MSLFDALSIANTGLAAVDTQFAVISQNVANASTPSYATEAADTQSLTADGEGYGVIVQPARIATDQALQSDLLRQNATAAGLQTTASALSAIVTTQGATGANQDLASLLGNLQNSFSTLLSDPSSEPQQQSVVQAASTLANALNATSGTITRQRQDADDAIVASVTSVNQELASIGTLSDQIIAAQQQGISTAGLENQRNAAISDLSRYLAVNVLPQSDGDVILTTAGGVQLPIHGSTAPLSVASATVGAIAYYPGGGVPGIMLNGNDITTALSGGQIAANVALRDHTLPTYQAELDEFAQNVSAGFAAQGLPLFTDGSGTVPTGAPPPVQNGYIGYAGIIEVNPQISADPSAVRDGLPSSNPSALSGFSTIINNVLTNVLGTAPVDGGNVSGLGPTGTLNAPLATPATLADFAATIVTAIANDSATAQSQFTTEQSLQSALQTTLSSQTGVNMDTEMATMIALQNAYGANAKIVGAAQAMFTDIMDMVVQ